jgi:hypothetical protein
LLDAKLLSKLLVHPVDLILSRIYDLLVITYLD